jgi:hypothetical protein
LLPTISVCISAGRETGSKVSTGNAEAVADSLGIALVLVDSSVFAQPANASELTITREIHLHFILLKVSDF